MSSVAEKCCTNENCLRENPQTLESFSVNKAYKDGRERKCRACMKIKYQKNGEARRAAGRKWSSNNREKAKKNYEDNKEARLAQMKQYRDKNPELMKARRKAYYEANKEQLLRKEREKYQLNPQIFNKRAKAYREKNREKLRQRRIENRQKHIALCKAWRESNVDKRRANDNARRNRFLNAAGSYNETDIRAKYELQGGLCYYCFKDLENVTYHVDHKIPLARGGSNWPANICCACPQCNQTKNARDFWEFFENR